MTAAAHQNTLAKFGITFNSAIEMAGILPGDRQKNIPFTEVVMDQPGLYILTNDIQINGAALILMPEILEQIGKIAGMDYYILPTSIHEIMIAKNDGFLSAKKLKSLLYEGNYTAGIVEPTDYCRQRKTLQFAK